MINQELRERPYIYIKKALELFHERNGNTIVEIGSMRQPLTHDPDENCHPCCNDGHSSIHWARAARKFSTVDINPECSAITRKSLNDYGFNDAQVISTDGIGFLRGYGEPIDLLYLDAWDIGTPAYSEHHLEAYRTAKPLLHENSIILIDDTDIDWNGSELVPSDGIGGKGRLVVAEALRDGFSIIARGRQVLLARTGNIIQTRKNIQGVKRVLVEGWRFVPHSYAVVAAGMIADLHYRSGFDLRFVDMPYYREYWKKTHGVSSIFTEKAIASIEAPQKDWKPDTVIRFDYPMRLSPVPDARTIVFGTTELGVLLSMQLAGDPAVMDPSVTIMTPSAWSRRGFIDAGVHPDRIAVIPHGIDTDTYYPLPEDEREQLRRKLGWEGRFVLLNVGALTLNKGIPLILSAAVQLSKSCPQMLVCLKGLNSLYPSEDLVNNSLRNMPEPDRNTAISHMQYIGDTLSPKQMSMLYQAADLYVSPYHAEGFNLPVLEAAACGLPVVCTAGGATDDFVDPRFARRIEASIRRRPEGGWQMYPDQADMIAAITEIFDDTEFRRQARKLAPQIIKSAYTWKHAVDRMIPLL